MIGTILSSDRQLSEVLELLTIRLQLTETQYGQAETAYRAVTTWLAADGSDVARFAPSLFPQGSLGLGTTVRPIRQCEFDLDVVCLLNISDNWSPDDVYSFVWDRMYANGTYRRIMERMPRCIRLNYAEDSQFHLDIVPAVPDATKGGTFLRIPDKPNPKLVAWKTSNPKGYATWFEQQTLLLEKYARAEVEPIPHPIPANEKAVLTKAVQLLKRWRDVRFRDEPELAPSSIILTTLAADQYTGEPICSIALTNILEGLVAFAQSGRMEIRNPANLDEVISEKWLKEPVAYKAFVEGITNFRDRWRTLVDASHRVVTGLGDVTAHLRDLFGEPAVEAIKTAAERVSRARTENDLYVERKTGSIVTWPTPTAVAVGVVRARPNNFYGE